MASNAFVLPAGFYFCGDPCYVVSNGDLWLEFLGETFFEKNVETARGMTIWAGNTMYGDGEYTDNEGFRYGVDAGLIGIVSMEDVKKMADEETLDHLKYIFENDEKSFIGRVVKFEKEFTVIFDAKDDPTHVFGYLEINTGFDEEELDESYLDEEYCEECEEEDDDE
jgi:hypothetical protein